MEVTVGCVSCEEWDGEGGYVEWEGKGNGGVSVG